MTEREGLYQVDESSSVSSRLRRASDWVEKSEWYST